MNIYQKGGVLVMARSSRQSKILELISLYEIETQDDLVSRLASGGFDVTQATISRDIKELGLIKIQSNETGKYKYAVSDAPSQTSNKYIFMLKESVISFRTLQNNVLVKTLKGLAGSVCSIFDKLNIDNVLGIVYGIDTVLLLLQNESDAEYCVRKIDSILNC